MRGGYYRWFDFGSQCETYSPYPLAIQLLWCLYLPHCGMGDAPRYFGRTELWRHL